jgi:hypothetical protein
MRAKAKLDPVEEEHMVRCPRCQYGEVVRRHRHGIGDQFRAWIGRWPYYCRDCKTFFYAGQRSRGSDGDGSDARRKEIHQSYAFEGSRFAYQVDSVRPTAKIVVQAESHAQMNEILLALSRAVAGYDRSRYEGLQLAGGKTARES